MHRLKLIIVIIVMAISHLVFTMELPRKDTVIVKTCYDDKEFELERWKIKHSLVLQVLQHEKKSNDNYIIIPKAVCEYENVRWEDVELLSEACEKKGESTWFSCLAREKQLRHVLAAGILNASTLFVSYASHFFDQAMAAKKMNPCLVDGRVISHLGSGIIQQQKNLEGTGFTDRHTKNFHDGSYSYIPKILQTYDELSVSGQNPIPYSFPVGQEVVVVRAMRPVDFRCDITNVTGSNAIKIWFSDLSTISIAVNLGKISHVAFANNGCSLITGSQGNQNNLACTHIGLTGGLFTRMMIRHKSIIEDVVVSSDSNKIVTVAQKERSVTVWDGEGLFLCNLGDFSADCKKVITFSRDSKRLVACAGNKISLWDISCAPVCTLIRTIIFKDEACKCCVAKYFDKAQRIVIGRTDGKIQVINIELDEHTETVFDGHGNLPISALVGDEYGSTIVSATEGVKDNLIVWDIVTGKHFKLEGHSEIAFLQMSPDALYLVSQSSANSVLWTLYSAAVGQALKKMADVITLSQAHFIYRLFASVINRTTVPFNQQEKEALVESLPTDPINVKQYIKTCFADILSQKDQHERK